MCFAYKSKRGQLIQKETSEFMLYIRSFIVYKHKQCMGIVVMLVLAMSHMSVSFTSLSLSLTHTHTHKLEAEEQENRAHISRSATELVWL